MAFNNTILARTAGAVWGVKLGNATTQAVLQQAAFQAGGLNSVIDGAFNASYGTTSDAAVAAMVVANLGLTGATADGAASFVEAQLAAAPAGQKGSTLAGLVNLFAGLTGDATFGAAATAFNAKVTDAVTYGATAGTQDGTFGAVAAATSFNLGTGLDNMTGTAGDDAFTAYQVGSANTLSSGDFINGGAGTDSLSADMASSTGLTTPRTTGVEVVSIRVQERATSSGDNNIQNSGTANDTVTIDAQRMEGVDRWESNNSRADLKIEDVRIPDAEITKQTTIAMVSTDPGNVDFAVYFDQHSLRAFSGSSSSIRLDILDVFAAEKGLAPLLDSPYDAVSFKLDGVTYTLQSQAINDAQQYSELKTALEAEIAKQPALAGVTVSLGSTFTVPGRSEQGTSIILSATNKTFDRGNWIASQGVPPNTLFYTNQDPNTAPNTDLITSTVVLDDVGRGSMGGDLVIGGLSVGETSSSKGVEKFDIIIERSSKLQVIASTANTLQEVVVTQGTKTDVYNTTGNAGKPGALTVVGSDTVLGDDGSDNNSSNGNAGHEGVSTDIHGEGFGFTDVRLINGSAMTGAFTFDAQITEGSFAKYIQTDDTQSDPKGDNTSPPGQKIQRADFIYSGGTAGDSIYVDIDPDITASRNEIEVGREDFTFRVNGNAGDDVINVSLTRDEGSQMGGRLGGEEVWYRNQVLNRNVTIDAGDGNDVVLTPGAGDKVLLLGAGDDATWTDNTGSQKAQWVVNSFDQTGPNTVVAARLSNDIRSSTNSSYELYKATVQVAFLNSVAGSEELVSKKIVIGYNATTFLTSDLHINQAIKKAINEDPVLKFLLKASDGPQNTLVINALTDGVRVDENLRITVAPTADALQPSELAALNTAWTETFASDGDFDTHQAAVIVAFNGVGDYVPAQTNNGAAVIAGTNSLTSADNRITGGLGNDVIVLSTTEGVSTNASSNERVLYAAGSFGNDTIVNFDVAGNGADLIDFSVLGGIGANYQWNASATAAATLASLAAVADDSIVVQALDLATASYNDTAAEVAGLFPDLAGVAATAARTYVYVAVHPTTNVASVYSVTDAIGASNVSAAFVGTIDLANVAWDPASVTAPIITGANFV